MTIGLLMLLIRPERNMHHNIHGPGKPKLFRSEVLLRITLPASKYVRISISTSKHIVSKISLTLVETSLFKH